MLRTEQAAATRRAVEMQGCSPKGGCAESVLHLQGLVGNRLTSRVFRASDGREPIRWGDAIGTTSHHVPRSRAERPVLAHELAHVLQQRRGGDRPRAAAAFDRTAVRFAAHRANAETGKVPPIVREELQRPGRRLDSVARETMENHFDHDFSAVRLHADEHAARATRAVGALAFTAGTEIVVDPACWRPGTPAGDSLLAHEFAHVVQQSTAAPTALLRFSSDQEEASADTAAVQGSGELRPAPFTVARAERLVPAAISGGRRAIVQWGDDPATVQNAAALREGPRSGPNAAGSDLLVHHTELTDGRLEEMRELSVVIHGVSTSTPRVRPGERAPRADVGEPGLAPGQFGPVQQVTPEEMARRLVTAGFGSGRWTYYRVRLIMCNAGVGEEESYASRLNQSLQTEGVRAEVMGGTGAVSTVRSGHSQVMPPGAGSRAMPQRGMPQVEEQYQPGMDWPMRTPGTGWQRVPPKPAGAGIAPAPQTRTATGTTAQGETRAYVGERDMTNVVAGGPHAGWTAAGNGAVLALQGINFVIGWFNDRLQKERCEAELTRLRPEIERIRQANANLGVMLVVVFTHTQGNPESPIQPGPQFARIEWGGGRSPYEAQRNIAAQPRLLPGLLPTQDEGVTQQIWIPALEPVEVGPPSPPLPVAGLGTFASRTPTLQDVEWSNMGGFDDEGTTALVVPQGMEPRFHILQIPEQVSSVIPRRENPEIKTQRVPSAVRNGLPVVRLDPTMPFSDVEAVALFPADNATCELFEQAPRTIQFGPLLIDDFNLVRWARPEEIRLVR